jgi:hypothetical protein
LAGSKPLFDLAANGMPGYRRESVPFDPIFRDEFDIGSGLT